MSTPGHDVRASMSDPETEDACRTPDRFTFLGNNRTFPFERERLIFKGIDQLDPRVSVVGNIPRGNRQAVLQCGRRDQTVLDRHCRAAPLQSCQQLGPDRSRHRIQIQNANCLDTAGKPFQELFLACSSPQQLDAVLHLAKNDWVDDQIPVVFAKPIDNSLRRAWPGRFAENIRIDKEFPSASVDSQGTSSNHPCSGQVSNQSTTPVLFVAGMRFRR